MSKKKPTPGGRAKKKAEVSLVRSSAAEYLTFVAASGQGGVEAVYADENVWLSQKMMGVLYDVETHTVNYHLKKVFDDAELEAGSVIRNFRITAADGKTYDTQHYNLSAIIAVGYKVNSERAVQFRKCPMRDRTFSFLAGGYTGWHCCLGIRKSSRWHSRFDLRALESLRPTHEASRQVA